LFSFLRLLFAFPSSSIPSLLVLLLLLTIVLF